MASSSSQMTFETWCNQIIRNKSSLISATQELEISISYLKLLSSIIPEQGVKSEILHVVSNVKSIKIFNDLTSSSDINNEIYINLKPFKSTLVVTLQGINLKGILNGFAVSKLILIDCLVKLSIKTTIYKPIICLRSLILIRTPINPQFIRLFSLTMRRMEAFHQFKIENDMLWRHPPPTMIIKKEKTEEIIIQPYDVLTHVKIHSIDIALLKELDTTWVKLQNLISVSFIGIKIVSIRFLVVLKQLPNLNILDLHNNLIENVENIAEYTPHLIQLDISSNRIISLYGLEMLDKLSELELYNNNLNNLEDLINFAQCCSKNLINFSIRSNPFFLTSEISKNEIYSLIALAFNFKRGLMVDNIKCNKWKYRLRRSSLNKYNSTLFKRSFHNSNITTTSSSSSINFISIFSTSDNFANTSNFNNSTEPLLLLNNNININNNGYNSSQTTLSPTTSVKEEAWRKTLLVQQATIMKREASRDCNGLNYGTSEERNNNNNNNNNNNSEVKFLNRTLSFSPSPEKPMYSTGTSHNIINENIVHHKIKDNTSKKISFNNNNNNNNNNAIVLPFPVAKGIIRGIQRKFTKIPTPLQQEFIENLSQEEKQELGNKSFNTFMSTLLSDINNENERVWGIIPGGLLKLHETAFEVLLYNLEDNKSNIRSNSRHIGNSLIRLIQQNCGNMRSIRIDVINCCDENNCFSSELDTPPLFMSYLPNFTTVTKENKMILQMRLESKNKANHLIVKNKNSNNNNNNNISNLIIPNLLLIDNMGSNIDCYLSDSPVLLMGFITKPKFLSILLNILQKQLSLCTSQLCINHIIKVWPLFLDKSPVKTSADRCVPIQPSIQNILEKLYNYVSEPIEKQRIGCKTLLLESEIDIRMILRQFIFLKLEKDIVYCLLYANLECLGKYGELKEEAVLIVVTNRVIFIAKDRNSRKFTNLPEKTFEFIIEIPIEEIKRVDITFNLQTVRIFEYIFQIRDIGTTLHFIYALMRALGWGCSKYGARLEEISYNNNNNNNNNNINLPIAIMACPYFLSYVVPLIFSVGVFLKLSSLLVNNNKIITKRIINHHEEKELLSYPLRELQNQESMQPVSFVITSDQVMLFYEIISHTTLPLKIKQTNEEENNNNNSSLLSNESLLSVSNNSILPPPEAQLVAQISLENITGLLLAGVGAHPLMFSLQFQFQEKLENEKKENKKEIREWVFAAQHPSTIGFILAELQQRLGGRLFVLETDTFI